MQTSQQLLMLFENIQTSLEVKQKTESESTAEE